MRRSDCNLSLSKKIFSHFKNNLLWLLVYFLTVRRIDIYTGYIQHITICLDTGLATLTVRECRSTDMHFGILLRHTELKPYFESTFTNNYACLEAKAKTHG